MSSNDDSAGWWGEFSFTGNYPVIAKLVSTHAFSYLGESHTEVYVVIGCNNTAYNTLADMCTASTVYVLLLSGEYVPYTGAYTKFNDDFFDTPITDIAGCQILCSRTFRYGVYARCVDGTFQGALLYHLLPEGSITRHPDTDGIGLSIPSEGEYFADAQGITTTSFCNYATGTSDTVFGNSRICVTPITMPNETGGAVFTGTNIMQYHVFGGCPAAIQLHHGSLNLCGAPTGASVVNYTFTW